MKKLSFVLIAMIALICVYTSACTAPMGNYIVGVSQDEEGKLVIEYSNGDKQSFVIGGEKGDKGDPGVKGDKGDPGEKGDKGDPGVSGETKEIEFRYYKSKVWWRYVGSDVWTVVVSIDEVNKPALELKEFAMSVYIESIDVSLQIGEEVKVNGEWYPFEINGNTLTVGYGEEVIKYLDVTVEDGMSKIVAYDVEGVKEVEVMAIDNTPQSVFEGTYTLKAEDASITFEFNSYGNAIINDNFSKAVIKGDTLYCKLEDTGEEIVVKSSEDGLAFSGKVLIGEELKEIASFEAVKWIDKALLIGAYSVKTADASVAFDFAIGAYSLELYDGEYHQAQFSVDTFTFEVDSVVYKLKYADGEISFTSNVEGAQYILTKWDNMASALSKFDIKFTSGVVSSYTINEYGGVECDGEYFGDAVQKANVLTIKGWVDYPCLVITQDPETKAYSAVYHQAEGEEEDVEIIQKVSIEDFVGTYTIKYDTGWGEMETEFYIAINPFDEGEYAIFIGDNPRSFTFDEDAGSIMFIDYRGGTGYIIKGNADGTKEVKYFFLDEDTMQPDPNNTFDCVVQFNKA